MKEALRELLGEQNHEETQPPAWLNTYIAATTLIVAVFTAVIAVFGVFLGIFTIRRKEEIDKTAQEVQANRDKSNDLLQEAEKIKNELDEMHRKAQKQIEGLNIMAGNVEPESAAIPPKIAGGNYDPSIENEIKEAIVYQDNKQYELAKERWLAIANITKEQDKETAARAYFSAAYLIQAGYDKYKERDESTVNEVISLYSKALEMESDSPEAFVNRGNAKTMLEQYQDAIEDYNKALDIKDDDAKAFNNRGMAKANLEQHKDAIEDFTKALDIKGDYAEAFSNRGIAKAILELHQGAIEDFDKALDINRNNPKILTCRGIAKAMINQYINALKDYDKALDVDEDYIVAIINRGYTRQALGDFKGAKEDAKRALDIDEENEPAKTLLTMLN